MFKKSDKDQQLDMNSDHVIVTAGGVSDKDVSTLQAKATHWDSIARDVPGMTSQMVWTADLLGRADACIVVAVNEQLYARGIADVQHVSQLFSLLNDKFIVLAKKQEVEAVAQWLIEKLDATHDVVKQWRTVVKWRAKRIKFAHPLGGVGSLDMSKLDELEQRVRDEPGFGDVRAAVLMMLKALQRL